MTAAPDLSVIVVTWNHRHLLQACLESVRTQTRGCTFEIVVADNASGDGTPDLVRKSFPEARLIVNATNLGYSAAADRAFAHSTGRNVCFLNHDTYLADDALSRLCRLLDSRTDLGAVGPCLRHPDGEYQTGAAGFDPSLPSAFFHYLFLSRLSPKLPAMFLHQPRCKTAMEVDWVCGACLMAPRAVYERVLPRDPRFPMYAEDWALCRRIRALGKRVLYVREVTIFHHKGYHSGERTEPSVAWVLASDRYCRAIGLSESTRRAIHILACAGFALRWLVERARTVGRLKPSVRLVTLRSDLRASWNLAGAATAPPEDELIPPAASGREDVTQLRGMTPPPRGRSIK